jgi:hypothetical protein
VVKLALGTRTETQFQFQAGETSRSGLLPLDNQRLTDGYGFGTYWSVHTLLLWRKGATCVSFC